MQRPPVQFTKVGDEHVAYQVIGDGIPDIVLLSSWFSAIDAMWEHPSHLRIWRTLDGTTAVHFNHRGTGASDPVPPERLGDLDGCVDDVLAVLDATGVERARILAEGFEGHVAIRLAVRHPERVDRIAFTFGSLGWAGLVPPEMLADACERSWGTGQVLGAFPYPDDVDFAARAERAAAGRGVASRLVRRVATWDVTADAPQVEAECLVLHMDVPMADREAAEELNATLPRSRLVTTHPTSNYWGDHTFEVILDFLGVETGASERELVTLVMTDLVGSTEALTRLGDWDWRKMLDSLDALVIDRVQRHGGRVVNHTGDGHLLEFSAPGQAVAAAVSLRNGARSLGLSLRSGVHTGEIERREGGDVGGRCVHAVARISALAEGDEVLVSQTVADLVAGRPLALEERGTYELKGLPGKWNLLAVSM